ncbi:hypothetical protein [Rickettsia tamurae]|uniref:hypothetical protein n=1 Tax=Rickettsia tamurae TaxID=334545 RepID=UPI00156765FB|nr:hypothetical protein [Rickettsia tamurae]
MLCTSHGMTIHELTYILRVNFLLTKCNTVAVLLRGLGNPFGVIPWLGPRDPKNN